MLIKKLYYLIPAAIIAAYVSLGYVAGVNGLGDVFLITEFKTATRALVTLLAVFIVLRVFDQLIGFNFKGWLENASAHDTAIYISIRFFAVCLLLGLINVGAA